jgi:hypothetical protein
VVRQVIHFEVKIKNAVNISYIVAFEAANQQA